MKLRVTSFWGRQVDSMVCVAFGILTLTASSNKEFILKACLIMLLALPVNLVSKKLKQIRIKRDKIITIEL